MSTNFAIIRAMISSAIANPYSVHKRPPFSVLADHHQILGRRYYVLGSTGVAIGSSFPCRTAAEAAVEMCNLAYQQVAVKSAIAELERAVAA